MFNRKAKAKYFSRDKLESLQVYHEYWDAQESHGHGDDYDELYYREQEVERKLNINNDK